MTWFDLLPLHVAKSQISWERRQRFRRARKAGASVDEIADKAGLTHRQVTSLLHLGVSATSPVERWFMQGGETAALHGKLANMENDQ
jgi:hypothetical protein